MGTAPVGDTQVVLPKLGLAVKMGELPAETQVVFALGELGVIAAFDDVREGDSLGEIAAAEIVSGVADPATGVGAFLICTSLHVLLVHFLPIRGLLQRVA